jgi:hypothetical protein
MPDKERIASMIANPPWQFKPWNPYKIMDTSLLQSVGWQYVIMSNYSLFFFLDWAGGFFFAYWLMYNYVEKQNKKKKAKENVNT